MDSSNQTSFIPKQALTRTFGRRHEPIGLFTLVATVILIISLLFLGGAYTYRYLLTDEIERLCDNPDIIEGDGALAGCGLEAQLTKLRGRLNQNTIATLETTDRKLKRAEGLLNSHQTLLPLLALLERLTLETIRYGHFDYNGETINLAGKAKGFESIALQSEVFDQDKLVTNYIFSDFTVDADNRVGFKLILTVEPSLTSYPRSRENIQ